MTIPQTDPITAPPLPIRTERLILRAARESDFEDIHAYGSDPEVARYMDWGPNTADQTREFLGRRLAEQAQEGARGALNPMIELADAGRVIGTVRLEVRDARNRVADLGYTIARPHWRQGYTSEAARALLDTGFRTMGLHRVYATCDVRNRGSWAVMEKLGMTREGVLRQDVMARDGWRDSYIYAILAEEWTAQGD